MDVVGDVEFARLLRRVVALLEERKEGSAGDGARGSRVLEVLEAAVDAYRARVVLALAVTPFPCPFGCQKGAPGPIGLPHRLEPLPVASWQIHCPMCGRAPPMLRAALELLGLPSLFETFGGRP